MKRKTGQDRKPPTGDAAPMSRSTRPDGRFLTTGSFFAHLYKTQVPRLAFPRGCDAAAASRWRKRVRVRLRKLLAFPSPPRQPAPRLISSEPRDGYTLQRWELYPEPFSVVPMLMLVPDGTSPTSPAPGVMCFPGSDYPKESLAGEPSPGGWKPKFGVHDSMALHYVRRGLVALAMDNPATGELADPRVRHWSRLALDSIWIDRPYECFSTFQKFLALQWFKAMPMVDRSRIAVSGFSLGAKPALLLGLLDREVKAVVWNSAMISYRRWQLAAGFASLAPWQYVPGLLTWFDYPDLMAALAPTPLLVCEGGRDDDAADVRKSYALAGARGKFQIGYMPGFTKPSARRWGKLPLPEGIDADDLARLHNFDGDHYFKEGVAVPWVCKRLRVDAKHAPRRARKAQA